MRRAAAIDIGTNSMRMLICEIDSNSIGNIRIVKKSKELITTRIGENVAKSRMLSEKAIMRNVDALKYFVNKAKEFGSEDIIAIATSAVRDAENRDKFIQLAKAETGIEVMVIEGTEEAELGIIGVMSELEVSNDGLLVIDIGGGSTELILGNANTIEYSISINVGAVRMTEKFIRENPITEEAIYKLDENLNVMFKNTIDNLSAKKISKVIAIGGTATTLASMYHGFKIYKPEIVHNSVLSIEFLKETFEKVKNMTIEERYKIDGLQKERADVIPSGLYILIYILTKLGINEVTISENDNLEGTIMKYILK